MLVIVGLEARAASLCITILVLLLPILLMLAFPIILLFVHKRRKISESERFLEVGKN